MGPLVSRSVVSTSLQPHGLYSPTGSSVHGILQARILEWAASSSLVAQLVKNLPATQETWVQSLGWEDPLEKEKATHSSILAWRIPWTEEPGGQSLQGRKESDTTEVTQHIEMELEKDSFGLTTLIPLRFNQVVA